jgi:hypothetical protein
MMRSKSRVAQMVEGTVKKSRFSEQQIIEILKLAEAGTGGGFVSAATGRTEAPQ